MSSQAGALKVQYSTNPKRNSELETDVQPAAGATNLGGDGERSHAVIVFADVVGYSPRVAHDEPSTLDRWTALYKNVLKPEAERRWQVGDLRGDETLVEFEQVSDALEWSEREFGLATYARRRQPFRQPETGTAYLEGLRAADLPD